MRTFLIAATLLAKAPAFAGDHATTGDLTLVKDGRAITVPQEDAASLLDRGWHEETAAERGTRERADIDTRRAEDAEGRMPIVYIAVALLLVTVPAGVALWKRGAR